MAGAHPYKLRKMAAVMASQGHTQGHIAKTLGVNLKTINRWMQDPTLAEIVSQKRRDFLADSEDIAALALRELEGQITDQKLGVKDRAIAAGILLTNRNRAITAQASAQAAQAIERQSLKPEAYREKKREILEQLRVQFGLATPEPEGDE